MKIQEYLVCAIQNIQTLIRHGSKPKKALAAKMVTVKTTITKVITPVVMATKDVLWHLNSSVFSKNITSAKIVFAFPFYNWGSIEFQQKTGIFDNQTLGNRPSRADPSSMLRRAPSWWSGEKKEETTK
jgi:hypothetical protein